MHLVVKTLMGERGASLLLSYLSYHGLVHMPRDDTYTVSLSINGTYAYRSMIFYEDDIKCFGLSFTARLISKLVDWQDSLDEITSLRIVERPICGPGERVIVRLL